MKLIYNFSDAQFPSLSEVGGKALSLIKMVQSGLSVPPGFVLTVSFFESWFEKIKKTSYWQNFLDSPSEELHKHCDQLKALCNDLQLNEEQEKAVGIIHELSLQQSTQLFAVRSSSPEEDLEGASFAGGYETILGVNSDN